MSRSKFEGGEDDKPDLASQAVKTDGYVTLGIPLAAVIAKLRGKTLVKVLRVTVREENNGHPR